jgi:YHS domain-containing protein
MKNAIVLLTALLISTAAYSQNAVFIKSGEAINGYDPVAYFKSGKPVKGRDAFTLKWNGADWKFASQENLNDFKTNPEKYAPQYGGYCAYGTSENHKAPTSPDAWSIVNGKLYLNYNTDVQKKWKQDQKMHIERADKNWPTVKLEKD